MKKLNLIIICLILLLSGGLFGQTSMISSGSDMISFMNTDLDYLDSNRERYSTVEGSPYLDEKFHEGAMHIQKKKFVGLHLRYNAFESFFEFETDEGIRFLNPKTVPIDTVWLNDATYLYIVYKSGPYTKQRFMKAMYMGNTKVFLKEEISMTDPEETTGYEEAKPPTFKKEADEYYIQNGRQAALLLKGKKSLEKIFPGCHNELETYVKKNKLKLKKAEDVVRLCKYRDTL